jgi:hypothetical protein
VEAKAGPAEASMLATMIAGGTGADAAGLARVIALALTGLGIALTQMAAMLGGYAASLIGEALRNRIVFEKHNSPIDAGAPMTLKVIGEKPAAEPRQRALPPPRLGWTFDMNPQQKGALTRKVKGQDNRPLPVA